MQTNTLWTLSIVSSIKSSNFYLLLINTLYPASFHLCVELMEKHMPTNVKQGVPMLMWTVKGHVLAVLDVTMVRATFLSMDKLTQRMTASLVPASVKMDNVIHSVVLLILVHPNPQLDVRTAMEKFGRMEIHLRKTVTVAFVVAGEKNVLPVAHLWHVLLDVKIEMAQFGRTDKHLWKTVTIAHVFAMEENVMLNVQGRYVHNLDVKTVTAKFGQTDKHLWKTVTIALVFAMGENVMLNVQGGYVHLHPLVVRIVMAML